MLQWRRKTGKAKRKMKIEKHPSTTVRKGKSQLFYRREFVKKLEKYSLDFGKFRVWSGAEPLVVLLRLFVKHSQITRSALQNSITAGPFHVFRSVVGFWRAPSCRRRFPFSQHFRGAALSCGSLVAFFSVACFWPGLLLWKSGFSWFSAWMQKVQKCVLRFFSPKDA